MSSPTVVQLRYLLALHETGHFGRAAAEQGVSQPSLSSQIQRLEDLLGGALVDRQAKPVVLTDFGVHLLEHARSVVAEHDRLIAAAAGDVVSATTEFSLGIIPTLAPYVLPWFVGEFARQYPSVSLSVFERTTDEMIDLLSTNQLDAGILATPLGESALLEEVLFYDPFYAYGHKDESLLKSDVVDVRDLSPERLWLLEDGHCFRAQVVNLCGLEQRTLLESVRFSAGSFETLRHIVDVAGGYTLFPETYARTLPKSVRQRAIRAFARSIPTREVSLVFHRHKWKTEVIDVIRGIIQERMPSAFQTEVADDEVLPIRVR